MSPPQGKLSGEKINKITKWTTESRGTGDLGAETEQPLPAITRKTRRVRLHEFKDGY